MRTPLAVPRSPLPRICTYTNLLTILQTLHECLCARASVELTLSWTCPRGTFRPLEHLDMRQTTSQTHKNTAKLRGCYVQLSTVHPPTCPSCTRPPSVQTSSLSISDPFSIPPHAFFITYPQSIYCPSVLHLSVLRLSSVPHFPCILLMALVGKCYQMPVMAWILYKVLWE